MHLVKDVKIMANIMTVLFLKTLQRKKRDNNSFRVQNDSKHHNGISPLVILPIDLVYNFPLNYMHLVCLGVMKKLLLIWTGPTSKTKMPLRQYKNVSEKLVLLSKFVPVEFNRKGRDLSELPYWKATEFRLFLLYVGPIALYVNIDLAVYEHILLFHCLIMILISEHPIKNVEIQMARQFLTIFVKHSIHIYE